MKPVGYFGTPKWAKRLFSHDRDGSYGEDIIYFEWLHGICKWLHEEYDLVVVPMGHPNHHVNGETYASTTRTIGYITQDGVDSLMLIHDSQWVVFHEMLRIMITKTDERTIEELNESKALLGYYFRVVPVEGLEQYEIRMCCHMVK